MAVDRPYPLYHLRTFREALNITPQELAHILGMAPSSYYRLERGHRRAYIDQAETLARYLNISLSTLLTPSQRELDNFIASPPIAATPTSTPLEDYISNQSGGPQSAPANPSPSPDTDTDSTDHASYGDDWILED